MILPTAARPRRGQYPTMNRCSVPRRPARGRAILLRTASILAILLTAGFVPVFPCPDRCRDWVDLRIRYLQAPGLSPEQRQALREFIVADACPRCNNQAEDFELLRPLA